MDVSGKSLLKVEQLIVERDYVMKSSCSSHYHRVDAGHEDDVRENAKTLERER